MQKYKKQKNGKYVANVWDGTYNANGTKHRKYLYSSKSSRDLEEKVAAFKRAVKSRTTVRKGDYTFLDYSREWLRLYKGSTAMRTKEMYDRIIEGHISIDPCVRLQDFRTVHMLNIFQHAAGHKKTQEQILMTIKQIVKQAVRDRRYSSTDAEDLFESFPKVKYAPGEKRPLTESEKEAVFKAELLPMDKAYLYLIYGCGLRREEALALYKYDFNWKRKEVSINKAHTMSGSRTEEKETKTANGVRTVPIPDSVRPFLEEYVKDCKTTALFRMRNGNPITKSSYDKMWRRILRGLQAVSEEPIEGLTAHIFRHNYTTELCYQIPDISIKHIARLVGDTEAVVLKVYAHVKLDREDAHAAVNAALG